MKESDSGTEPAGLVVIRGRETGAADMAPSAPMFTSDNENVPVAHPSQNSGPRNPEEDIKHCERA